MLQKDTNLFEVNFRVHEVHTIYVRVPKIYEGSFELFQLIESLIENEQLEYSGLSVDDAYIESQSINVSQIEDDDFYSSQTTLVIPTCRPEDLNDRSLILDATITRIDE